MIIEKLEQRNFDAISAVTVNGQETPVMNMYANYSTNKSLSFNSNVRDIDLYFDHQAEVDQDYDEWKDEVINLMKGDPNGQEN